MYLSERVSYDFRVQNPIVFSSSWSEFGKTDLPWGPSSAAIRPSFIVLSPLDVGPLGQWTLSDALLIRLRKQVLLPFPSAWVDKVTSVGMYLDVVVRR